MYKKFTYIYFLLDFYKKIFLVFWDYIITHPIYILQYAKYVSEKTMSQKNNDEIS